MQTDMSRYIGQWVAICDQKVISYGKNVKEVFRKAKEKCPAKRPLLTKVPEKETMIF